MVPQARTAASSQSWESVPPGTTDVPERAETTGSLMWALGNTSSGIDRAYRSVFECAADCIFMINTKREIVEANAACTGTFAWPAGMFAPMQIHRVITDVVDPAAAGTSSVEDLLEPENRDGVLVIAKSFDGRRFRAEVRTAAVHGSRKISHVVYLREVPAEPAIAPNLRQAAI